jgi:zinc D-Ala-D-Ala carboxypeptidase
MKLSEHFSLREMTRSQTAKRLDIDNTPDAVVIENLRALCVYVLEPVRNHFAVPFSPSSGYRSPQLNKAIGSSSKSQHIKGYAADFEIPGVSNHDAAKWIVGNCSYDQLILEFHDKEDPNSGWVHCSFVGALKNREKASVFDGETWQAFRI